jgi:hypothetical protein
MSGVCSTHGCHELKVVPVVGLPRYDVWGSRDIVSQHRHQMVVSHQLHVPTALPSGKNPPLHIKCLLGCDALQFGRYMTSVMNVEIVGLSETLVPVYQITRHHMTEDRTPRHRRENLKHHSSPVPLMLGHRVGNAPSRLIKMGDFLTD